MNKYTKNWIWNRTVRYWLFLKYCWWYKSLSLPTWFYPHKKFESKEQEQEFAKKFKLIFKNYKMIPPIERIKNE